MADGEALVPEGFTNASIGSCDSSATAVLKRRPRSFWLLLVCSSIAMLLAFPASSILYRLYYVNGGNRRWLLTWTGSAGWPLPAALLAAMHCSSSSMIGSTSIISTARAASTSTRRRRKTSAASPSLLIAYAVLGCLSAADNLMFSWSYSYLPASTSALLSSSSLTFTALFAYLLVAKKLNAFSLNAIFVMTAGGVLLGLDASSDRPPSTSSSQYAIGFVLDIVASALHGLIFALSELLFIRFFDRDRSLRFILEVQAMTSLFACVVSSIGVVAAGELRGIQEEARRFKDGPVAYAMVLLWATLTNQIGVLASVAVLSLASTLLAGVLNAARVPLTAVASVICFGDNMSGLKIMSVLLTVWSFGSYIYGAFLEESLMR